MVQYFAEHLDGFATTRHGWVQSYGSRCTRPPILHGDVSRPAPITVRWAELRPVADGPTGQGHAHRAGDDRGVVVRPPRRDPSRRGRGRWRRPSGRRCATSRRPASRSSRSTSRRCGSCCRCVGGEQADYLSWAVEAYRRATSGGGRPHADPHASVLLGRRAGHRRDRRAGRRRHDASSPPARARGSSAEPAVAAFARGLGPGRLRHPLAAGPGASTRSQSWLATALRVLPARAGVGQPGLRAEDPHVPAGRGGPDQCGHRGPAPARGALEFGHLRR